MHRISFDGNEGTGDGRYGLWLKKSVEDLAKIPGGPAAGMVVTIYMTGEIEGEAVLEWCGGPWNAWTARVIEGTFRDNNETWENRDVATSAPLTRRFTSTLGGRRWGRSERQHLLLV